MTLSFLFYSAAWGFQVIGTDDRVQLNNTNADYHQYVGNFVGGCTGTIIGPRHILTSAHCVRQESDFETLRNLNFLRGVLSFEQAHNIDFLKAHALKWRRVFLPQKYIELSQSSSEEERFASVEYDYALVELETQLPEQIHLDFVTEPSRMQADERLTIVGYPGDKAERTLWKSECKLSSDKVSERSILHECDTSVGNSGSALIQHINGKPSIIGIHASTSDMSSFLDDAKVSTVKSNQATRIYPEMMSNISDWIMGIVDEQTFSVFNTTQNKFTIKNCEEDKELIIWVDGKVQRVLIPKGEARIFSTRAQQIFVAPGEERGYFTDWTHEVVFEEKNVRLSPLTLYPAGLEFDLELGCPTN